MPIIPFPEGVQGAENLPRTRKLLQNCLMNENKEIFSRPGIAELNTTGGVARGGFSWNGSLYQVSSTDLIKITNTTTGAFSAIGTIAGPEPVITAVGFNTAVIVVQGGAIYMLDKSDVLTLISGGANFQACRYVDHIDGRFVYIPSNGDPAFFSDVGAAQTVQALSFFDAEELPDANKADINHDNTLYILGADSIEQFRNTGASPNPFIRNQGGRISVGYIGGLIEYFGTFAFIGREKGQDRGIYSLINGAAPKISNPFIDTILAGYAEDELGEVIPGRLKWRGYDILTFALRRHSFCFMLGRWFMLDTVFDGVSRTWGAGYITQFNGEYFTAYQDKIGKFQKINTDYGERITRIIDLGLTQEDGKRFSIQKIELGISQGYNTAQGSVALFMSRDNVIYGPGQYKNLGLIGRYGDKLVWNPMGGLGNYDGFVGMRLFTTEDVDFSADVLRVTTR